MRAEKVVLSFVAVLIGLIAAGTAFYLYQATKTISPEKTKPITIADNPTPPPLSDKNHLLKIDKPTDEEVFEKRQVMVSGQAVKNTLIVVSTEDNDEIVKTAENGNFNLTITIPNGTSILKITAIYPDGVEKSEVRTITFSTEDF